MKSFINWLLSPSRAIQIAQAEIDYLRGENRRLSDLLTQAWESKGIVPIQEQHQKTIPLETETPKTLGAMQIEYEKRVLKEYQAWQIEEQARLEKSEQTLPVN